MSKPTTIIIDGNNQLHRAYNKYNNMHSHKRENTSIIFGFPYILSSILSTFKPDNAFVVFDGGRDKRRIEILPEYKRKDKGLEFDSEGFYRQRDIVLEILTFLDIPFIFERNREADDYIWLLARRLKRKGHNIIIISTDKDFNQLISTKLSIWNPHKKIRFNYKNLVNEVGYEPHQTVSYLSLLGDKSDNIPGIRGFGEKTSLKFVKEFDTIENFISSPDSKFGKLDKAKLTELYKINKELIDIRYFCRSNKLRLPKLPKLRGDIMFKELNRLASRYDITTFSKDNFLKPFLKLNKHDK